MGEIGSTGIGAERALDLSSYELGESGTTQKSILHLNTAPPAKRRIEWLVVTKMKPSAVTNSRESPLKIHDPLQFTNQFDIYHFFGKAQWRNGEKWSTWWAWRESARAY